MSTIPTTTGSLAMPMNHPASPGTNVCDHCLKPLEY